MRRLDLTEEQKHDRMLVVLLIGGTLNGHQVRRLAGFGDEGNGTTPAAWKRLVNGPMVYRFGTGTRSLNMLSDEGWRHGIDLIRSDKALPRFAKDLRRVLDSANQAPNRIERAADVVKHPTYQTITLATLLRHQPLAGVSGPQVMRRHTSPRRSFAGALSRLSAEGLVQRRTAVNEREPHLFWDQFVLTPNGLARAKEAAEMLEGRDVHSEAEGRARSEVVVVMPNGQMAVLTSAAQRVLLAFRLDRSPKSGTAIATAIGVKPQPLYRLLYELADLGFLEYAGAHSHSKGNGPKPYSIRTLALAVIPQLLEMTVAKEAPDPQPTLELPSV